MWGGGQEATWLAVWTVAKRPPSGDSRLEAQPCDFLPAGLSDTAPHPKSLP
jgi:hypothetical protein